MVPRPMVVPQSHGPWGSHGPMAPGGPRPLGVPGSHSPWGAHGPKAPWGPRVHGQLWGSHGPTAHGGLMVPQPVVVSRSHGPWGSHGPTAHGALTVPWPIRSHGPWDRETPTPWGSCPRSHFVCCCLIEAGSFTFSDNILEQGSRHRLVHQRFLQDDTTCPRSHFFVAVQS